MKFLCAMLAAALMLGREAKAQPKLANAIDVIVNVAIVTRYQVYAGAEDLIGQLSRQYRNQPEVLKQKLDALENDSRQRLVENELILHEFETAGYSLPESVIDDYVQAEIRSGYSDRATLTKQLQAKGLTYERFRKQLRDQFILRQMRLKYTSEALIISPHKIEVYYAAHTNDFKIEERVKLRMIVLNKGPDDTGQTRKLADEILSKLNEGASFAEMARTESQGMHSSEGGEWGWVERFNSDGAPVLRKELDDVAFTLKPGERSGVVEAPEACYLLLVEDRSPGHVKPLTEVRDEIESKLLSQESNRLQQQWIDRLKKKTFVRYFMETAGQ